MNVRELFEHFVNNASWVDPEATADAIEYGDPDKPVRRIGTGWTGCVANLRAAAADGCDLYITHEPSFCEFWDPQLKFRESAWGRARVRVLEESGMAQIALHDTWDVWPTWGIGDSWLSALDLGEPVAEAQYRYQLDPSLGGMMMPLFEIPETTVDAFAAWLAEKVRPYRQHGVAVMARADAPVRRVAVGAGCTTPSFEMIALGADTLVQPFDRAFQTITRIPCVDLGASVIVLEHGVSEMPGMENMARYIEETFPDLEATFYCHEPVTRMVSA